MRKNYIIICLLLLDLGIQAQDQSHVLKITDFGYKPDSRENAVMAVKQALNAAVEMDSVLIEFPKGRYDFWPQHATEKMYFESNTNDINPKRCAVLIEGMKNVVIDGGGSEFVFHDRMQPFTVDNSSNIELKNFSIDWDIPLTAQAEVVNVSEDTVDLKINTHESPFVIENDKIVFVGEGWKSVWWGIMEFDKESKLIPQNSGDRTLGSGSAWKKYKAEVIGNGIVRVSGNFKRLPKVGNFLVMRHSVRDHAGIFLFHSKDLALSNIQVHHTAGLGILSQFTENISFQNVNVEPNLAKGRFLSGHDDGLHFSNCKGLIQIENCSFSGLMDDPVNVHGTAVRIVKKMSENKLRCVFVHHQTSGLLWGRKNETVGFIENESMETLGTRTITDIDYIDKETFELSFGENIPEEISAGDALENLSWTPDVTIRNNYFGNCRARGLLISTPGKVLIEENTFESSGSAILIAGDANYWYESGGVKDVTIKNNIFKASNLTSMYQFCKAIISVFPEIPNPQKGKSFHRNIRIEANEFHPFDYPILYALSVDTIKFNDNVLMGSKDYEPWHPNKYNLTFDSCKKVEVSGNTFNESVLGKNVLLRNTPNSEVKIARSQNLKMSIETDK